MASNSNESNESSEGYHDQIVQYLLQKATLRSVKFELNLDNTQAGNFNACSLFLEESKKWYFVLASSGSNSSKTLTEDVLFPAKDHARTNGEFSLFSVFRSYCDIEDYWNQAEGEKKFVLLTNKELNHSDVSECTEMDEIFKMSDSSKFHTLNTTNATLRQFATFTNREFEMVRKAIVALFIDGEMSQILKDYKSPLAQLFSLRYGKVKFAENFSEFNKDPRVRKLFNLLKEDFAKIETDIATVSVERTNMEDFWTISSRNLVLPPVVDRATVKQFFDSLVIGSAQPCGQDLQKQTNNEWRLWMLSWVEREDFELLTKNQLEQPCVSFKKAFEEWESGTVAARGRKCLNLEDGMRFLQYVEFELDYSLRNCTKQASEELSKIEQQFIRRRIVYNNQYYPPSRDQYLYLQDTKLIDRLYSTFNNEKVFVLEAEPGMGRTTLWRYLAFYAQNKYPDCAVFLIHLNKLSKTFGTDGTEMEDLFKCSDKRLNGGILKDDSRKKLVFLDGFDELSAQKTCFFENLGDLNRDKVIDIVETILERNNTKVFFNCRHIFTNMFQLTFNVKAMQLEQFNDNEKIEFLSMFWNISEQNKAKFEVFAKHVLSKLKKDIKQNLFKIVELPLMLKMLGEWYSESIKKFLSEDKNTIEASEKLSDVNLFKNYVENSIKNAIHKGNNLNNVEITTEYYQRDYQLLSVYKMVPEDLLSELIEFNPNLIKSESEITSEILCNRNESSVLQVVDGIPMFAHLAFASFLCARFFYENVEKIKISDTMVEKFAEFFENNALLRVFFFSMVESEPKDDLMLFVSKLGERSAFWACEGDCFNVVNYLKNVFKYNEIRTPFYGRSMLQVAVEYNSQKVLEVLLELKVNLDCADYCDENPLQVACRNGHFEIMQALLSKGATLNIVQRVANFLGFVFDLYDSGQNTILHYAAKHGSVEMVQFLIDRSARIDVENNLGETPLFLAVRNNHLAVAELLIKTGANISHKDHYSSYILHAAVKSGNVNLVKLILDYASNQNIDKATFIDCRDYAKRTPLHVAVQRDFQDVVAFLVSSKANVNAIDKDGESALHIASIHGHLELVRCLIEGKANPNLLNSSRQTPLYVAIVSGHLEVVKFLRNIGPDIRRINHHKKSVLNAAVKSGNVELVKYLMKQFRDASDSAILYAAEWKHTEIFKVLLAHGADPSTRDSVTGEKDGKYELDTSGTNIVFKTLGGKIRERLFYVRGRSNSDESSTSN
ncbi:uncharacterized protein LOC6052718 [Culex quinquefasciatus]|uniref:uncharacterized protein LOC6052718 n=1 Tax=Culex quinquefasciatus TaxID=7176 RepID=UPI0018E30749|nr:uncharacterized protein LOC6052718 [Culex quinquefasciatus]